LIKLSREAIVGIFNGTIIYWDDNLISQNNANFSFPHEKIVPLHLTEGKKKFKN
jgi:phosphate transport system substrate-binding protein